jgi:hypothetical protein
LKKGGLTVSVLAHATVLLLFASPFIAVIASGCSEEQLHPTAGTDGTGGAGATGTITSTAGTGGASASGGTSTSGTSASGGTSTSGGTGGTGGTASAGPGDFPDCGCPDAACPGGEQPCGLPGQPLCPDGYYCITHCCVPMFP